MFTSVKIPVAISVLSMGLSGYLYFELEQLKQDSAQPSQQQLQTQLPQKVPKLKQVAAIAAPRLNLPPRIYGRKGHPLQLYWRGIIEAKDPYAYDIRTYFERPRDGYNYPRYYQVVTNEVFQDAALTIELRDNQGNILTTGQTLITVRDVPKNPETKQYVLAFGDSLTAKGEWVTELSKLANLNNVEFIGNQGKEVKWVGYGGKNWYWYANEVMPIVRFNGAEDYGFTRSDLTSVWLDSNNNQYQLRAVGGARVYMGLLGHNNPPPEKGVLRRQPQISGINRIDYNGASADPINPFWDPVKNKLSFKYFADKYHYPTIDRVMILLSWNGLKGGKKHPEDHQELIADTQKVLRQLHLDYPHAKVQLFGLQLPSLNGGLAHDTGDDPEKSHVLPMVQSVFGLNLAYQQLCATSEFSSYCEFIDVATQFDSENNMPQERVVVNHRATIEELRGSNGVHPSYAGYLQIADIAYRNFSY